MSTPKYDEILNRIKKANGLLVESHPTVSDDPHTDAGKPKSAPANANTAAGTNAPVPTNQVEKLASIVTSAVSKLKALHSKQATAEVPAEDGTKTKSAAATAILEAVKQAKVEKKEAATAGVPEAFTPEFHFKLAQAMLETEEGVKLATQVLEKKAGIEAAQQLIKAASDESQAMQQQADIINAAINDLNVAGEYEKLAAGLMSELPEGAAQAPVEGAGGVEAVEGAEGAEGAEGVEGAEGEITAEEVMEALTQLVDSGEITEEQAQEIVNELSGDEATGDGEFSEEELETALSQLLESGELTPEDLQTLAGAVGGDGAAPAPEAVPAETV